jgi:hypothetical protein
VLNDAIPFMHESVMHSWEPNDAKASVARLEATITFADVRRNGGSAQA